MQVIDKKQLALHRAQGSWKQLEAIALNLCDHVKTGGDYRSYQRNLGFVSSIAEEFAHVNLE